MKHLGDITKLSGYALPPVDIITGGSPCQDLSVAGKRAGLSGERSGLFMDQIRIIKEMRDNDKRNGRADDDIRPRFMVWENVPGAFSSNKGEDFRAVLEETAKVADSNAVIPRPANGKWAHAGCILGDGWSIAWRLHDAQFWGVPQRRKRIALVADFRGGGAPEILFERKGVPGDIKTSAEQEQRTTTDVEASVGKTSRIYDVRISSDGTKNWRAHCYETNICRSLDTGGTDPDSNHGGVAVVQGFPLGFRAENTRTYDEKATTVCNGTRPGFTCGVVQGINGQTAGTLDSNYYKGCGERQGVEREVVCVGNGQLAQAKMSDKVGALNCMHDQQAIMTYGLDRATFNQGKNAKYDFSIEEEKIGAQVARGLGAVLSNEKSVVRRLTPLECERLQGFPDGWTDIGEWIDSKGKKHKDADSPRYKALGNSIALPFWEWMAERMIKKLNNGNPTMASLFDGIGGFPLVFSRHGCEPVWASEIEEFPMAVTERRFNGR